jgi:hypothetical protein
MPPADGTNPAPEMRDFGKSQGTLDNNATSGLRRRGRGATVALAFTRWWHCGDTDLDRTPPRLQKPLSLLPLTTRFALVISALASRDRKGRILQKCQQNKGFLRNLAMTVEERVTTGSL